MPIASLRMLDVQDKDEEDILQDVLDYKLSFRPAETVKINTAYIPDIKTPEEEAKWQKIIDEKVKPKPYATQNQRTIQESFSIDKNERFCEFCDSKGVRHKKDCKRPK